MQTFDSLGEEDSPAEDGDEQNSRPGLWLLDMLLDLFPGSAAMLSLSPPPDDQVEEDC